MIQFSFALLQAAGSQQSMMPTIIMMVALFAIIYFFMIRPQNKKQKEIQKFRDALEKGMEVITIGGIHGKIASVNEEANTITLEVSKGTEITFERSAIMPKGTDKK